MGSRERPWGVSQHWAHAVAAAPQDGLTVKARWVWVGRS